MNCEFTDIVNLETDPELPAQWAFSKFDCQFETLELIQSGSTQAEFYLDKRVSYGDVFVMVFISLYILAITCRWIGEFIFKD